MNISKYFTEAEVFGSHKAAELGISNYTQDPEILAAIQNTAFHMDQVREFLNAPIIPSSWYRCLKLNTAIGSKPTSQHVKGESVDYTCPKFGTAKEVAEAIAASDIHFDQLIYERPPGKEPWVHTSFCSDPDAAPRHSILTYVGNGQYLKGIV